MFYAILAIIVAVAMLLTPIVSGLLAGEKGQKNQASVRKIDEKE